jgi:predicted HAD superfamily Cof-like phosphohydrolase
MQNPIKRIVQFNEKAGLLDRGYDDFLESSYQVEEALEGLPSVNKLTSIVQAESSKPKDIARAIVKIANDGPPPSDVGRLDKACDAVVFAIGSMAKLGLSAQQITKALNVVMDANMAKLSMPKDEFGKLTKPSDFEGPEAKLQAILDERCTKS